MTPSGTQRPLSPPHGLSSHTPSRDSQRNPDTTSAQHKSTTTQHRQLAKRPKPHTKGNSTD